MQPFDHSRFSEDENWINAISFQRLTDGLPNSLQPDPVIADVGGSTISLVWNGPEWDGYIPEEIKMKWVYIALMSLLFSLSVAAAQAVDINTADAETIADSLTGVGLSKAQAIVAYREAHGDFKHRDELVNVKGIGLKLVDKNRDLIIVVQGKPEKS